MGRIELMIGITNPKTNACTVAKTVGMHETWIPVSCLNIAAKTTFSIGIEAKYPQMIEGITNKKLCTKIIEMQLALLRPISLNTPVSKVLVSTEIMSKL